MRKPWLNAVLLVVGLITVLLCWPSASYDLARVHPSLRDLPRPYRSVKAGYYLDGGSVSVEIIGADGTIRQFAFPIDKYHSASFRLEGYPRLFVGGLYMPEKPEPARLTEITNSPDTRTMLIRLMYAEAIPDVNCCNALIRLRGAPKDWAKAAWFVVRDRLQFHD